MLNKKFYSPSLTLKINFCKVRERELALKQSISF